MQIIVDTREQRPWTFDDFRGFSTVRRKLDAGDYSVEGLEGRVAIERKSLDDWIGTVMRERSRFYRELDLLRGLEYRAVIIEASVADIVSRRYSSLVAPDAVLGFVAEVSIAQSVPVLLGGSRVEAQYLAGTLLRMAAKKVAKKDVDEEPVI